MPTSSSSSSVHHAADGLRRSSRLSANSASSRLGEHPGKAAKGSRRGHSVGSMGPQEDPAAKNVPKGPVPKRERVVVTISYRECRKNHAASIGGYAVDGCREFMAGGEEGTNAALMCAACGCHRSFHKREVENKVTCDCDCPSDSTSSWRR